MSRRVSASIEVSDLLLSETAHLRDHLGELYQVSVEDSGGVLGDVHVISAGVGDAIGRSPLNYATIPGTN